MRVLVTGITGFVGGHFAETAAAHPKAEIYGLSRRRDWPAELSHLAAKIPLYCANLSDLGAVVNVLKIVEPSHILHLAGYALTGQSFREPDAAWDGNLTATRNLYRAVELWGGRPRILYVSTGQVYGAGDAPGRPCDEQQMLRPVSPYAASKAAADLFSYQVTCEPGLDVVRARPFNHIGPRQSPGFAIANFTRQIAMMEQGALEPVLETGDLSASRDLTDVCDIVSAYWLLLEKGRTGEVYNIGSGLGLTMESVVEMLRELTTVRFEIRRDPQRMRRVDPGATLCDAAKIRRETGWVPQYAIRDTLTAMLERWRKQ